MMRHKGFLRGFAVATLLAGTMSTRVLAQDAAAAAPHQAGTVKASSATSVTLTTAAGADVTVNVPAAAKILVVPPGAKDLKSATPGTMGDVATGDRVLVTGTAGDAAVSLTATRVILMKSAAIAQTHAVEDAAWTQGSGGIVTSVDVADSKVMVGNGAKTITVLVTPATVVRHYSGDSVRFADAAVTTLAAVKPGDQLRVRGMKSADGLTIMADEMVAGTFHNYSGLISSIDTAAGTVTLKDLTTKKTVTVAVTSSSDVRRLPAMVAQRVAQSMKSAAGGSGVPAAAGAPPAVGAETGRQAGAGRRAGADLSQMLSRMPTETLAGLKAGDAVMIVATSPTADSTRSTAVTLLAGVDAILTASPTGEMTLTPWGVGGGGGEGEGGAGGGS